MDTSASPYGGTTSGLQDVADSVVSAVRDASDYDALALRRFGGTCGDRNSTDRPVDFGIGNRDDIRHAASRLQVGGRPTLEHGIITATDDFDGLLSPRARLVNRIIVITRHGADACQSNQELVQQEVSTRIKAVGLSIQFRLVGYQVPASEEASLRQLATAAGAPAPAFTQNPAGLASALVRVSNFEPVVLDAQRILAILNPVVNAINTAVQAVATGDTATATQLLNQAHAASTNTDTELRDLSNRSGLKEAQTIHRMAIGIRSQQTVVLRAADDFLARVKTGGDPTIQLNQYNGAIQSYNDQVRQLNGVLRQLMS